MNYSNLILEHNEFNRNINLLIMTYKIKNTINHWDLKGNVLLLIVINL